MKTTGTFVIMVLLVVLSGCAHVHQAGSSPLQSWARWMSAEETARCKQVGWEAARSSDMWERFKPKRLTSEPLKLMAKSMEVDVDPDHLDRVEVTIPSGLQYGFHASYISVTIARGTYEVLGIQESFWP